MVNSGSFDSDGQGDRNAKAGLTQPHNAPDGTQSSSPVTASVASSACNSGFSQTADGDLPSVAIEPTPTKTEFNCDVTPPVALSPAEEKASLCCSLPLEKIQEVLTSYHSPKSDEGTKQPARKLLCLYCDRSFVSANLRQKHVERIHSVKQNRRVSSRRQNQLTVTPCVYCDRLNGTENTLKDLFQHLVNEHPSKYFGCLPCEDRFLTSSLLADHNAVTHQINPAQVTKDSDIASDSEKAALKLPSSEDFQAEEEEIPVKVTRSRMRPKLDEENNKKPAIGNKKKTTKLKELRSKKLSVKSSRIALKRRESKRLQAIAKLTDTQKKKRSRPSDKKNCNSAKMEQTNSTKSTEKVKGNQTCVNPYPEFDNFYRVKKITDHSIDNLKISSLTFDDVFDKAFFNRIRCNIEENLLHHIDGKLFKNEESENRISNFEKISTGPQEIQNSSSENYGCELSLNAVTPVASLSLNSQFGEDFESQIEYGSKPSKKKTQTRKDEVHYKYFTRRKYQASILEHKENRDLSKLDMWTQLVIKKRQQKMLDDRKSAKEILEYTSCDEYKNKLKREELNRILDRRGPFEDLKEEASKKAALDKLNSASDDNISEETFTEVREVLNEILNRVFAATDDSCVPVDAVAGKASVSKREDLREIPSYLNLRRSSSLPSDGEIDRSDRIALICSSQETENFELPTNQVRGKDELIELTGEWARCRMFVCAACGAKLPNMRYLLDHKSMYHQNVWVQHYEFVGNQSELYRHLSIPVLGKVGAVEESVQCKLWRRSDARLCTKCGKQCNSLGELHRHILECGEDWTWMLARKKCKYRPFGAKSRRKRRGLIHRIHNKQKTEPTEKKTYKKTFEGPRQRPSDADTIQRMLANLPAKRSTRKLISLQDGVYRSRKSSQKVQKNKVKCGKVIYKSSTRKETTEQTVNTLPSKSKSQISSSASRRSLRNLNKVLASRILDTNTNLSVKRKIKALNERRRTRQSLMEHENIKEDSNDGNFEKNPSTDPDSPFKAKLKPLEEEDLESEEAEPAIKRSSPRSSPKNLKKMSMKKLLTGKINIKSFFPVKKKKSNKILSENQDPQVAENVDVATRSKRKIKGPSEVDEGKKEALGEPKPIQKKSKHETFSTLVRSLSLRKKKLGKKSNKDKSADIKAKADSPTAEKLEESNPVLPQDSEQLRNTARKRKLKNSFRNVINQVKKLKIDNSPDITAKIEESKPISKNHKEGAFLDQNNLEQPSVLVQEEKVVTPSTSEAKENSADLSTTKSNSIDFHDNNENPPIPETIFKLELNNEKSLQAKGELDFDTQPMKKSSDSSVEKETKTETILDESRTAIEKPDKTQPISIETSVKPKIVPLISPNMKGKIRKPTRGLNDCIAMLTSKLQQKTAEENVIKTDNIFTLTPHNVPPPLSTESFHPPKSECILKIPTYKSLMPHPEVEEIALDLSTKSLRNKESAEKEARRSLDGFWKPNDIQVGTTSLIIPTFERRLNKSFNSVDRIIEDVVENKIQAIIPEIQQRKWNSVDDIIQKVIDDQRVKLDFKLSSRNSVDDIIDFVIGSGHKLGSSKTNFIENLIKNKEETIRKVGSIRKPKNKKCPVEITKLTNVADDATPKVVASVPTEESLDAITTSDVYKDNEKTFTVPRKATAKKKIKSKMSNETALNKSEGVIAETLIIPSVPTFVESTVNNTEEMNNSFKENSIEKVELTTSDTTESLLNDAFIDTSLKKNTNSATAFKKSARKVGQVRNRSRGNKLVEAKTKEPETRLIETNLDTLLNVKEVECNPRLDCSTDLSVNSQFTKTEEMKQLTSEDEPHLLENKPVTLQQTSKVLPSDSEDDLPLAVLAKSDEKVKSIEQETEYSRSSNKDQAGRYSDIGKPIENKLELLLTCDLDADKPKDLVEQDLSLNDIVEDSSVLCVIGDEKSDENTIVNRITYQNGEVGIGSLEVSKQTAEDDNNVQNIDSVEKTISDELVPQIPLLEDIFSVDTALVSTKKNAKRSKSLKRKNKKPSNPIENQEQNELNLENVCEPVAIQKLTFEKLESPRKDINSSPINSTESTEIATPKAETNQVVSWKDTDSSPINSTDSIEITTQGAETNLNSANKKSKAKTKKRAKPHPTPESSINNLLPNTGITEITEKIVLMESLSSETEMKSEDVADSNTFVPTIVSQEHEMLEINPIIKAKLPKAKVKPSKSKKKSKGIKIKIHTIELTGNVKPKEILDSPVQILEESATEISSVINDKSYSLELVSTQLENKAQYQKSSRSKQVLDLDDDIPLKNLLQEVQMEIANVKETSHEFEVPDKEIEEVLSSYNAEDKPITKAMCSKEKNVNSNSEATVVDRWKVDDSFANQSPQSKNLDGMINSNENLETSDIEKDSLSEIKRTFSALLSEDIRRTNELVPVNTEFDITTKKLPKELKQPQRKNLEITLQLTDVAKSVFSLSNSKKFTLDKDTVEPQFKNERKSRSKPANVDNVNDYITNKMNVEEPETFSNETEPNSVDQSDEPSRSRLFKSKSTSGDTTLKDSSCIKEALTDDKNDCTEHLKGNDNFNDGNAEITPNSTESEEPITVGSFENNVKPKHNKRTTKTKKTKSKGKGKKAAAKKKVVVTKKCEEIQSVFIADPQLVPLEGEEDSKIDNSPSDIQIKENYNVNISANITEEPPIKIVINKQKTRRKSKSFKKIDLKGQNDLFEDFALVIKKPKRATSIIAFTPADTFSKDIYPNYLNKPVEDIMPLSKTITDTEDLADISLEMDSSVEEMDMELDEIPINSNIIERDSNSFISSAIETLDELELENEKTDLAEKTVDIPVEEMFLPTEAEVEEFLYETTRRSARSKSNVEKSKVLDDSYEAIQDLTKLHEMSENLNNKIAIIDDAPFSSINECFNKLESLEEINFIKGDDIPTEKDEIGIGIDQIMDRKIKKSRNKSAKSKSANSSVSESKGVTTETNFSVLEPPSSSRKVRDIKHKRSKSITIAEIPSLEKPQDVDNSKKLNQVKDIDSIYAFSESEDIEIEKPIGKPKRPSRNQTNFLSESVSNTAKDNLKTVELLLPTLDPKQTLKDLQPNEENGKMENATFNTVITKRRSRSGNFGSDSKLVAEIKENGIDVPEERRKSVRSAKVKALEHIHDDALAELTESQRNRLEKNKTESLENVNIVEDANKKRTSRRQSRSLKVEKILDQIIPPEESASTIISLHEDHLQEISKDNMEKIIMKLDTKDNETAGLDQFDLPNELVPTSKKKGNKKTNSKIQKGKKSLDNLHMEVEEPEKSFLLKDISADSTGLVELEKTLREDLEHVIMNCSTNDTRKPELDQLAQGTETIFMQEKEELILTNKKKGNKKANNKTQKTKKALDTFQIESDEPEKSFFLKDISADLTGLEDIENIEKTFNEDLERVIMECSSNNDIEKIKLDHENENILKQENKDELVPTMKKKGNKKANNKTQRAKKSLETFQIGTEEKEKSSTLNDISADLADLEELEKGTEKELKVDPEEQNRKLVTKQVKNNRKQPENKTSESRTEESESNPFLTEDNNQELRRSRRGSRKIASYNENDLVDPLLDEIDGKKKMRKKEKTVLEEFENKNLKKSKDSETKLNSDELFDMLKASSDDNNVVQKPCQSTFLNDTDDLSKELNEQGFDTAFEHILNRSSHLLKQNAALNKSREEKSADSIYEFSDSPEGHDRPKEDKSVDISRKQNKKASKTAEPVKSSQEENSNSVSISDRVLNTKPGITITPDIFELSADSKTKSVKSNRSGKLIYCEICDKKFMRTDNLAKHKRTLTHIQKLSEIEAKEAAQKSQSVQSNDFSKTSNSIIEITSDSSKVTDNLSKTDINIHDILQESDKPNRQETATDHTSFANNHSLKLADIINDVLNKPVLETDNDKHNNFSEIIMQNNSDLQPEYRRYKSLGERKSFDSEPVEVRPVPMPEPYVSKTTILEKQISLLENIIENQAGANFIDDISMSSNNSLGNNDLVSPSELSSKQDDSNTYTRINLAKPSVNDDSFLKPSQYEEISEDSVNLRSYEDQKLRKTLNRDEELFLECCSLLKSGSEMSSYSNRKLQNKILNTMGLKQCDEPEWLERKSLVEKPLYDVGNEYSDNSRIPTPLGDSYEDDASNSNTISWNWNMSKKPNVFEDISEDNVEDGNKSFSFQEILNEEEKAKGTSSISKFSGILTKTIAALPKVLKRSAVNCCSEKKQDDLSDGSTSEGKKIITKGARKVFEGLKVSIPTEELNLEEVLNCSPKTKKMDIAAMQNSTENGKSEEGSLLSAKPSRTARKSKPVKNKSQFGSNLLFKMKKKKMPSPKMNSDDVKTHDVYDFEETQDNTDVFTKPDFRAFRNKKSSEAAPEAESDADSRDYVDSFTYGPRSITSSISSSSSKKPKSQENITKKKCMIMGRIFKNAAKSKIEDIDEEIRDIPALDNGELVENYVEDCKKIIKSAEIVKPKLTEKEINQLFDQLLEDRLSCNDPKNSETKTVRSKTDSKKADNKKKIKPKNKKRPRTNSDSTDDEFSINKNNKKRAYRKNAKAEDNCINLEQELKECIGVASRKSQRKCTSGKQNVLVEYWSSDDSQFEALLESQRIEVKEPENVTAENGNSLEPEPGVDAIIESDIVEPVLPAETHSVEKRKLKVTEKKPPPKRKPSGEKRAKQFTSSTEKMDSVLSNRRKRAAANPLYHWSSSSEDESQDLIEVKPIREELEDDEDRPVQHGWIVGDSPKKLVTMLAQAKGKKTDIDCVKEQGKKRTNAVS